MTHPLAVSCCLASMLIVPLARADSGWTDLAHVQELTATAAGRYVAKVAVSQNPSGCRDKQSFYQDYSDRGADQMYAALLQAVTNGKKVRVYVTGGCELNGHAQISSVTLVQ